MNNFERGKDPKEALVIGKEAQIYEKLKNSEVYAFIDFLDNIPEICNKYRNRNANYDDAFYSDVPMKLLKKHGITRKVLLAVYNNTESYEGWIDWDEGRGTSNKMSCGGGA